MVVGDMSMILILDIEIFLFNYILACAIAIGRKYENSAFKKWLELK